MPDQKSHFPKSLQILYRFAKERGLIQDERKKNPKNGVS